MTNDYQCDYKNCNRKPYAEVFPYEKSTWSYLCIFHFYLERLRIWRMKEHSFGWCKVDKVCPDCGKDLVDGYCEVCEE